jgi:hypothetical protein
MSFLHCNASVFVDGQALSSSVSPRWNPMKEQPITTRDSCLSALHSCQKSHHCALVYKKLKDSCQKGKKQCNSPSSQRHCLSLWMELQSTSLSNCTCALSRRKCQGIWSVVNNNSCIQNALEALASTGLHDLKDRSNTRKKLTGKTHFISCNLQGIYELLLTFKMDIGTVPVKSLTYLLIQGFFLSIFYIVE